jgi:PAS domain S-box-containing protein
METTHENQNGEEAGYRALFEQSPESMLVIDTAGRIARFNESAHMNLGYSRDEFARLGIREIDPFETEEGIRAKVSRVLDQGSAEFDVKQRTKSGDLREIHVITRVISWGGRKAFSAIWRDVTQQSSSLEMLKNAVRQAEEGRARAEAIVDSIGEAISIQDAVFRVLYQNRISRDLIGAHEGEYCYSSYERRDRVCDGCPVLMSFNDGKPHTAVRNVRTERGTSFFEITASVLTDPEGRIVAGIEVARDITKRKRAEDEFSKRIDALSHAPEDLIAAIKKVYDSGRNLGFPLEKPFVCEGQYVEKILPHEILSARELQVLCMIAEGKTGRRIAEELSLSVKTIATFRSRILKKMKLTNNAQLAQYALRRRLID